MKKTIAIVVCILFVLSIAGLSLAVEKATEAAPTKIEEKVVEKKASAKIKQATGEVTAVDTKAMTITVMKKKKDKSVETVVTVDEKTKIMMGTEKKTLADMNTGDKVTVKYKEIDGKNMAKSVAIKTAAGAPEKKMGKK